MQTECSRGGLSLFIQCGHTHAFQTCQRDLGARSAPMLYKDLVVEALAVHGDAFAVEGKAKREALTRYGVELADLAYVEQSQLADQLSGMDAPGAIPAVEMERGFVVEFGRAWRNAEEARAWAMTVLAGATTVGVDGSQLIPSKEYGVPVGMVQIAWFENRHDSKGSYVKDARVEVLAGEQLANHQEMRTLEDRLFHGEPVNQRRFALEIEKVLDYLKALPSEPVSLILFDGSLVASFASQMRTESRNAYVRPLVRALHTSTQTHLPMVGYIDTSYASGHRANVGLASRARGRLTHDALVFDSELVGETLNVFDRTCAFVCARGDILEHYLEPDTNADYSDQVCFVYLKTGVTGPPSRIEFPRSIVEAKLLDRVMDIIRAEIIIGTGYPYPIEAADAAAVLSTQDRMAFYRVFQDFAVAQGLEMAATAKMSSKKRRRYGCGLAGARAVSRT